MKRMRGLLAHSPAIAISMLALVFALGSGAGYAASTVTKATGTASAGKLVFHHLKLHSPWFGHAEYTVVDGIVHLSGLVVSHKTRSSEVLKLPPSLDPKDLQSIPIAFGEFEGDGSVSILPNGAVLAFPPPHGDDSFVSLSGVSYSIGAP